MAFDGDPYRTLGLARGATLDEVKRAYRRLAKANHPDSAGSGGLARFLAIQAAYEQLVEGPAGPGRPSSTGRRASSAEPDHADATRRAYGDRARARRSAGGGDGPAGPGPAGGGARARGDGGTESGRAGRAPGDRPGKRGTTGEAGPDAGRRRGKATLGSTSYDDANPGRDEPDWSGASWYGTTSGTYWTINPKEYADPRKHGPEYQARARRSTASRPDTGADEGPAKRTARSGPPGARATDPRPRTTGADAGATGATAGADDRGDDRADATDASTAERVAGWTWAPGSADPARDARPDDTVQQRVDPPPPSDDPPLDPGRALAGLVRALIDPRAGGPRGRVVRAFVGWLPVALGIGWVLGEVTGCGRFAATCDPAVSPLILLLQGAALVGLLLTPVLASLAATAAVGLFVAAVAATLVLSATGTAADEASRRATLGLLLVVAWLAGLGIAVAQRVRAASSRAGPVS